MKQKRMDKYISPQIAEEIQQSLKGIRDRKFYSGLFYYIVAPSLLFFLLSPGLFVSIVPVEDCDSRVTSAWMPNRVTYGNAGLAALGFLVLVWLWFYFGSKTIPFPFAIGLVNPV